MWLIEMIRRSLDRDLDSGMVRLKGKALGLVKGKAPNIGDAQVRILRGGKTTMLHEFRSVSEAHRVHDSPAVKHVAS
jgi:hypothetical protein